MHISLLSDLHLEMVSDDVRGIIPDPPDGIDLTVLAGDICMASEKYRGQWQRILERLGPGPILLVPDNHEFYGTIVSPKSRVS